MGISPLSRLLGHEREKEIIHECRRCGMTLESATTKCPACDTDSIARYEIE